MTQQSSTRAVVERIQRDPLYRLNHVELQEAFAHLHERVHRGMIDVSECVPVQRALKNVMRAVAEAERQLDIRETEQSISWSKRSMHDSQESLKKLQKRLAELTEVDSGT